MGQIFINNSSYCYKTKHPILGSLLLTQRYDIIMEVRSYTWVASYWYFGVTFLQLKSVVSGSAITNKVGS